uniref:Inositol polyphosphate-related phosphatase domain-containing protein n=1 Tax=Arcella intermedia TaxID=1963864 RepID=A0A6B2KXB8_9EUKA
MIQTLKEYSKSNSNLFDLETDISSFYKETSERLNEYDETFDVGSYLRKLSSVGGLIAEKRKILSETIKPSAAFPMTQFINEWNKTKEVVKIFNEKKESWMQSVVNVKLSKSKKEMTFTKLQKKEQIRDQLGKECEEAEQEALFGLTNTLNKSKWDLVELSISYFTSLSQFHEQSLKILKLLQKDIDIAKNWLNEEKERSQSQKLNSKWRNFKPKKATFDTIWSNKDILDDIGKRFHFPKQFKIMNEKLKLEEHPLVYDLYNRTLSVNNSTRPLSDVLQVIRINEKNNVHQLKFVYNDNHAEKWAFDSKIDRERCYESFWFLREGLDRGIINNEIPTAETIKVLCATYNMGDAPPLWDTDPLDTWIPRGLDVYAIATQECSYSPRIGYQTCEEDFSGWICSHLGEEYFKLASTSLMSIRLFVFIKKVHYYRISNLKVATVATGIGGVLGNKGGAAVMFVLYDTPFCFVGTHLAARIERNRLMARNLNYRDVMSRLPFSVNGDNHNEFDHLFWMGDLNYRLELERDKIMSLCNNADYYTLLKNDQLIHEKNIGNCFYQFKEGPIRFRPTYRFERGSRVWSEEKLREPAYCDRILWKSLYPNKINLTDYNSSEQLMTSDHSPLYAIFDVKVDYPCLPYERKEVKIILKDLKAKNLDENVPKLELNATSTISICFQAAWLLNTVSTEGSGKFPDSEWEDTYTLIPIVTQMDFLKDQAVKAIFRITTDGKSKIIGSGAIKLQNDQFCCDLSTGGIRWGKLYGTMLIVCEEDTKDITKSSPSKFLIQRGKTKSEIFATSQNQKDTQDNLETTTEEKPHFLNRASRQNKWNLLPSHKKGEAPAWILEDQEEGDHDGSEATGDGPKEGEPKSNDEKWEKATLPEEKSPTLPKEKDPKPKLPGKLIGDKRKSLSRNTAILNS